MYVSKEKFAGQFVSVGRSVVVGSPTGARAAIVASIDAVRGVALFVPPIGASAPVEGAMFGYEFVPTTTPAEADALGPLQWSFPPRV